MVDLATRTGDVIVHLSRTLRMAQPPVERDRRVMYTGFWLPPRDPDAWKVAQRRFSEVRQAATAAVSQPASPVA